MDLRSARNQERVFQHRAAWRGGAAICAEPVRHDVQPPARRAAHGSLRRRMVDLQPARHNHHQTPAVSAQSNSCTHFRPRRYRRHPGQRSRTRACDPSARERAIPGSSRGGARRNRIRKIRTQWNILIRKMGIQLERIVLRQIRMPLVHFFETSFGRTTERHMILVEAAADGVSGWGEVTAGENPFYNEEWTESAWLILRDYAAPRLLGRNLESAADVAPLTAHIRGHQMARGGAEVAVWDLAARQAGIPLWQQIGGGARREIPCGVSIGIQDSVGQLLD